MATSILSNSFRVKEVQVTKNFDVRLNIKKYREFILFKTSTIQDNINLAYTISKEVNSINNIYISDKSTALAANRIPDEIPITTFTAKTYTISNKKFKITDVFTTATVSQEATPLFYKHTLLNFDSTNSVLSISSIEILDKDKNLVYFSEKKYDLDNGYIYSNIENCYDSVKDILDVKYIRYTVFNSTTEVAISYIEIINNQPVYHLASFEDLDETTGLLDSDSKAYLIDEFASNSYEITLPVIQAYSIQEDLDSRIRLISAPLSDTDNPWYLSVSNDSFFTTLNTSTTTTNIYKYDIPEFLNQTFNPYYPYKLRQLEGSIRLNNHLLKTIKKKIQLDENNLLHIQIVLRNTDLSPRKVFNTDPSKIGTLFEDKITITDSIRSVDQLNGFIDVDEIINEDDVIEVTYYYEETEFEIIDVDFNPVSNLGILGTRVVFYIVPNTAGTRTETIFYLIVDELGRIVSTSKTDNSSLITDIATNDFYYDAISPSIADLSFLDKYTVQARYGFEYANAANPKYLVLGDVFTNENSHPRQTAVFDIRKDGGGIKESKVDELIEDFPQIQYSFNVGSWDGIPYPGNSIFYIELPATLQEEYNGKFNDISLRDIIERHVAFGIYPLIDTYPEANPIVTLIPFTTSIKVEWRSFGPDKTYNLYYNTTEIGSYTKVNTTVIIDSSIGNTYTISGLSSGVQYWVYVVYVDSTGLEISSNIVGISPNNTNRFFNKASVKTYS